MQSCQRGGCTTQSCLRFVMVGLDSANGVSSPGALLDSDKGGAREDWNAKGHEGRASCLLPWALVVPQ